MRAHDPFRQGMRRRIKTVGTLFLENQNDLKYAAARYWKTKRRQEIRRIKTANGPGMVLFSPNGRYAYVPSSFTPELDVVDTRS